MIEATAIRSQRRKLTALLEDQMKDGTPIELTVADARSFIMICDALEGVVSSLTHTHPPEF